MSRHPQRRRYAQRGRYRQRGLLYHFGRILLRLFAYVLYRRSEPRALVDVTYEAVQRGLAAVKPWATVGDIAHAVQTYAEENGFSVVREFGGHGIGNDFHEDPFVFFVGEPGEGAVLAPGMCFTIEPMINLGTDEIFIDSDNDWTVYTEDGAPSAQWEVTVAVTEDGYEILAY